MQTASSLRFIQMLFVFITSIVLGLTLQLGTAKHAVEAQLLEKTVFVICNLFFKFCF